MKRNNLYPIKTLYMEEVYKMTVKVFNQSLYHGVIMSSAKCMFI